MKKNNDTVGIANLKKGDDVSKVRKDLSNKDISQAEKERILENAFKHEGKYYISSVIRLNNVSKEANIFFGINEDTDVKKFFFVSKYNLYIAVIEENDEEYIIPYSLSHMLILENGQRYKLSQAVELLSNSNN